MKKVLPIVGVALVLLALAGGGYLYFRRRPPAATTSPGTSETASTADWETYHRDDHGFSFQYPPDWELSVITSDVDTFVGSVGFEDDTQEKFEVYTEEMTPSYGINIRVEPNAGGFSAEEARLDNFMEGTSRDTEEEKLEEADAPAGMTGITYLEGTGGAGRSSTVILFADNDRLYTFTYSASSPNDTYDKFLSVFNQLVASFEVE